MAKKKESKKEETKKAPAKKKAAVKKAEAVKEPAKKTVKKKAAAKKSAVVKSKGAPKVVSAQERYHMIDEAAYYRAEKTGFQVDPHENWIAAEQEIDELFAKQNIVVG